MEKSLQNIIKLLTSNQTINLAILVLVFLISVCLIYLNMWISDIRKYVWKILQNQENNTKNTPLVHVNNVEKSHATPPVKTPPYPRGQDLNNENTCNHEWYEIDHNYKDDGKWYVLIYCPACKQEKEVDSVEWSKIRADQNYETIHSE